MNAPPAQPAENSHSPILFNIPNTLTAIRILSIPGVIFLMQGRITPRDQLWAAILFGLAFFTDFFDGMIARKTQAITRLGRIMDPIADKLLVLAALLILVKLDRVNVIVAMLLMGRELAVSGLRNLASDEGIVIRSRMSAKLKTTFEGFGLGFLLAGPENNLFGLPLMAAGTALVYTALGLALWSAAHYFRDYWRGALPKSISP